MVLLDAARCRYLHNLTRVLILMTRDGPLWLVILSVCSGASIGALLRWAVSYWLNPIWSVMPLGTLCVNLLGCYLIGIAVAWLTADPSVPPAVRLFLLTGFLGGLTAFSAFSGENVAMLATTEYLRALVHMLAHVAGSFAMTALGMLTWKVVQ